MAKKTRYEIFYLLSRRTAGAFFQKSEAYLYLRKRGFCQVDISNEKTWRWGKLWEKKRSGRLTVLAIVINARHIL